MNQARISRRYYCADCQRKRVLKFLYLLWIPYLNRNVRVCVDCFDKYGTEMTVIESAAAATKAVK